LVLVQILMQVVGIPVGVGIDVLIVVMVADDDDDNAELELVVVGTTVELQLVELVDLTVVLELQPVDLELDDPELAGQKIGNHWHNREVVDPRASRPRLASWEAVAEAAAVPVTAALPLAAGAYVTTWAVAVSAGAVAGVMLTMPKFKLWPATTVLATPATMME